MAGRDEAMLLKDLPVGAYFRFLDDPPEFRRKVLGAGGALVMVETWSAMTRFEGTYMGFLTVEPEGRRRPE